MIIERDRTEHGARRTLMEMLDRKKRKVPNCCCATQVEHVRGWMRALKQNDPRSWLGLRVGRFYLDTSTPVKLVVWEYGVNRAAEMVDRTRRADRPE